MGIKDMFFIPIYPSDITEIHNLELDLDTESISLKKIFGYFEYRTLPLEIDKIRTFSVSDDHCKRMILITESGKICQFDISNQELTVLFENFTDAKDLVDSVIKGDFIYLAGKNFIKVFFLYTWQKVFEIRDTDFTIKKIKKESGKIVVLTEDGYGILTDYRGISLSKEKDIIDITFTEERFSILKKEDRDYIDEKVKGNIIYLDFSDDTVAVGTDSYDEERGSLYLFRKKDDQFLLESNINIKGKIREIKKDRCNNLYILSDLEGKDIITYHPYSYIYADEGYFRFSVEWLESVQLHRIVLSGEFDTESQIKISISSDKNENLYFINKDDIYIPDGFKDKRFDITVTFYSDYTGRKTPVFRMLKVYLPRKTYLDYLPDVYSEDEKGRDILERYLSIFQSVTEEIENKIKDTPYLLDPFVVSEEFLEWLSGWFALFYSKNWEESRWRTFLNEAYDLFKIRGSRKFFERVIEIITDEKPVIVESFQLKECKTETGISDKLDNEYFFCVFLKSGRNLDLVKSVVREFKPAYTESAVTVMPQFISLGSFVLLGLNSIIHNPVPFIGQSLLQIDTYIDDLSSGSRISERSRLSIDTKLII
ncbi:hypothetical protein [Persephonella sp.]